MFGYVRKDQIEVIDGDSIWDVSRGEGRQRKYRLIGYDSPELGERAKAAHEAQWGADAKAHLEQIVGAAGRIRIAPALFGRRRTRFDERLARLYLDGRDVKDLMIEANMAVQWTGGARPRWDQMER